MTGRRKLRVLFSVAPVSERDNPYITLLERSLVPSVEAVFYTKWRALFSNYDVLHIHWPDHLLRGGGKVKVFAKQVVFSAVLLRTVLLRTPIVRTLHNITPHEWSNSKIERVMLRWLDKLTKHWILLNKSDAACCPGPSTFIPHGHYRNWYPEPNVQRNSLPQTILNFGLIRRYKQTPSLVAAFRRMVVSGVRLEISGAIADAELMEEILKAAGDDRRIFLNFQHLNDQELIDSIARASLVVLPYKNLGSSGALLLAMSYGTPVLVPDTNAGEEFKSEFGEDWVKTYAGDLDGKVLDEAARWAAGERSELPDLTTRGWHSTATLTRRVYGSVISGPRKRKLWLSE